MQLQKGQKVKLEESMINSAQTVKIAVNAPFTIDVSCFGLDSSDKLSNDAYMVFYNQKESPNREIILVNDVPNSEFSINLSKLPDSISKLVFTAAIDPSQNSNMSQLGSINFSMNDWSFSTTGSDFQQEKAVMIVEIYKKENVWRLGVNGQGFSGGLESLLVHFGGAAADPAPTATPVIATPAKISLEKKFETKAPQLVSLAKKASVSLAKYNLESVKARSAFVIDASGSMTGQYSRGKVQATLNRVFPLGVHFDDNDQLETWAFAQDSHKYSDITFDNYTDYVNVEGGGWKKWMSKLNAGYNNEPAVIRDVIKHFTGLDAPAFETGGFFGGKKNTNNDPAPFMGPQAPVFVLFISDGGVAHNDHIKFLLRWASTLPIFWQFVGIGGSNYGVLQELDELSGRYIDNANFFAIDDLDDLTEEELYDRMVGEFPQWLKLAHDKTIIKEYKIG